MINQQALKELIELYKMSFTEQHWKDEKYKWIAVRHFQEHWDINAPDFGKMFEAATKPADNLLGSKGTFPRRMIKRFAEIDDEAMKQTKQMFVDLYNEDVPLADRIEKFGAVADELLKRYDVNNEGKSHFQDDNAISTYLWLNDPDKHYIYKFTTADAVAKKLGSSFRPKLRQSGFGENIKGAYELYDEICAGLQKDEEFCAMLRSNLDDSCWPDESLHTATQDFGFFVQNLQADPKKPRYWLYSPGRNAKYWDEFYHAGIMAIGWNAIGDLSKFADKSEMQKMMTERIDSDSSNKNAANATWQFVHEVKPGDIVFVKRGRTKIIGCGVVKSDYKYDASRSYYKNVREVEWTDRGEWDYPWIRVAVTKTLTDMTPYPELVENLKALFPDVPPEPPVDEKKYEEYKRKNFLDEVYITEEEYDELVGLLEYKKNVILQGPPGVGKTFAAKRLAYSIMGEKDDSRIEFVQFHQNYSYEDFVMGFKPDGSGFKLEEGVFFKFCKRAAAEPDPNKKYFFIIDEINRGNMSKIFGELLMLIENDKRGDDYRVKLPYTDKYFSIPDNLYIIGMMNTADRSLAMIDYALRRRFAFFTMEPAFRNEKFEAYRDGLENEKFKELMKMIGDLNEEIKKDKSLGKDFMIGHSYFCNKKKDECTDTWMQAVIKFEIVPMLREYWYENTAKADKWRDDLLKVVQ